MDVFQAMRTFVAVVEAGSFVGAMDAAGLSKPAVSRHITELEAHLGVRLLQRTTRRLSVTNEGHLYYQHCKELLNGVEEAEAEVRANSSQVKGRLRICAPQTFGAAFLAPLWGRFSAENPLVHLDIILSDRIVDIVDEGFDVAVRITSSMADSDLVARKLASSRLVLCASPAYLAVRGTPLHPQELDAHDVIAYSYLAGGDLWSFSGPNGQETVRTHSRIQTNSGDTCRAAALANQGIILQPEFTVYADLKKGRLVELMPEYQSLQLGVFAVYPTRKQLPLKVRRLVDYLAQEFQTPPWLLA